MKVLHVVGARPNFGKIAPIMAAMAQQASAFQQVLIHTGQHYDENMSAVFFKQLGLPKPDVDLGVGPGTHAGQTARVMLAFEKVVLEQRPDLILVVGDVNSTLACALVAAKLVIPVAHVEAGLRSFDRQMPEEINRILTDAVSDYLFTTSLIADENLQREGVPKSRIFFVGNVMIDTLMRHRKESLALAVHRKLGLDEYSYALVTLHRPANVDERVALESILSALYEIGKQLPVVFVAHPRTRARLREYGLENAFRMMEAETVIPPWSSRDDPRPLLLDPLGYLEFLCLLAQARVVLTDSGGIQEETTVLGVPCLTLRQNTERPETVSLGTNQIVGTDPATVVKAVQSVLERQVQSYARPPLWDGHAAERIVDVLLTHSPR